MAGRLFAPDLDREFVTIYFMQEVQQNRELVVRRLSLIFGTLLFCFLLVACKVWLQMQVVKLGYEITQSRKEFHRLQDESRVLLTQRNALASLDRIELLARTQLQLEVPSKEQLIFLVDPAVPGDRFGGFLGWVQSWMPWLKP